MLGRHQNQALQPGLAFTYKDATMKNFILIAAVIGGLYFIFSGLYSLAAISKNIKTKCNPTELYVIGNREHKARVYDCSNIMGDIIKDD